MWQLPGKEHVRFRFLLNPLSGVDQAVAAVLREALQWEQVAICPALPPGAAAEVPADKTRAQARFLSTI